MNASHELKSPLTSIMGSSELISSGLVKDMDTITDLSSRILEESRRMNLLVLDMLNLSKYENQMASSTDILINLQDIAKEVIKSDELLAKKKHITLVDETTTVLWKANHEHMTQLFRNLIENSIQYGNESGNVYIKLNEFKKEISIEISDDGIGIPKQDQSRVFERFYRVDKARSKKTGGTGLGLSIVKHIVMMYQGQIELESTEGKGTSVNITFPKGMIEK